jgi:hypothetical protein
MGAAAAFDKQMEETMLTTTTNFTGRLPQAATRAFLTAIAAAAALAILGAQAQAQHSPGAGNGGDRPVLHLSARWKECSFQLDPSLTREAWKQFTGEAGLVTYFRPVSDAAPMGARRFEVALVQWSTAIDDADAAWNDTFVHPDSTHWLFDGNRLPIPGLTARLGLTDRTDAGVYFTKNPNANYGFYGAQLQHAFLSGVRNWSAAARLSFVSMFGPEDLDLSVYGVDLVASRKYAVGSTRLSVSPYVVLSSTWSRSREKSPAVDLPGENIFDSHASFGAVAQYSVARIGVEYSAVRVSTFSVKVGVAR